MANGGRRVVIDDTHPSIIYSTNPPWFLDDTGTTDSVGNFGKSLNTTLHGTTANSSFSFSFSGTAIDIYGTNSIRNSSGVIDPLWTCYLNGVQLSSPSPFRFQENNWRMCGIDGLLDMNHTFTLSVSTLGRPFLFDYLIYTPSPNSVLQSDSIVLVPFSDSNLVYDSSWQFWSNISALTRTRNAAVQFQFTGTSLSWYGIYPRELPIQPAAASFSIDGGAENPFVLQGLLSPNASTAYNQLLFRTDVYPHGLHTLIVNFNGANNTTPLSLAYILLQREQSGGTLTAPTHTATVIAGDANRPSISIASLVCGAVALCVVMAASLAYFFILKKRKQKTVTKASPASISNSNLPIPRTPITTARCFDLASSSPQLGVEGAIAENNRIRRLTWHEKLRTSFSAAFNRTPHLGMVVADASTASTFEHRKKPTSPQILSLWARRNFSRQGPQLITDENAPHRRRLPLQERQGQEQQIPPMGEFLTSDRPESRDVEDLDGNIPTSGLSLPIVPAERSASSADASYYGGYRTKREMIELERRQ